MHTLNEGLTNFRLTISKTLILNEIEQKGKIMGSEPILRYTSKKGSVPFNDLLHTVNKIMFSARVFVVLLVALMFSACVFNDHYPYPEGWENPPAIGEDTCTDIAGTFEATLNYVFWNRFERREWAQRSLDVTHVTVEQVTEGLVVSAWADAILVARREMKRDERHGYLCTTEGIAVKARNFPPENMLGYIGETVTLFKASDGALIGRSKSSGGGLALGVIPMYGSGTYWDRYRPYTKPAKTQ